MNNVTKNRTAINMNLHSKRKFFMRHNEKSRQNISHARDIMKSTGKREDIDLLPVIDFLVCLMAY